MSISPLRTRQSMIWVIMWFDFGEVLIIENPKIYPGPRDRNEGGEKNKEPGSGLLVSAREDDRTV